MRRWAQQVQPAMRLVGINRKGSQHTMGARRQSAKRQFNSIGPKTENWVSPEPTQTDRNQEEAEWPTSLTTYGFLAPPVTTKGQPPQDRASSRGR